MEHVTYNLPHDLGTSVVGAHGIALEWLTSLSRYLGPLGPPCMSLPFYPSLTSSLW